MYVYMYIYSHKMPQNLPLQPVSSKRNLQVDHLKIPLG